MRRDSNPDFIEAVARGLDVIRAFGEVHGLRTLREISDASGLARPTARRVLITLEQVGYVRSSEAGYELTPRVMELGMSYLSGTGIWDKAQAPLVDLSTLLHESCSIGQLDGSDIVYVARAAVPKLVTLSVSLGTRFPAYATSLGKVILAHLSPADLDSALEEPTRSTVRAVWKPSDSELRDELGTIRDQGYALTDQQLAPGVRSVAVPLRDRDGIVYAALNVNANSAETSMETIHDVYLPALLQSASTIEEYRALEQSLPQRRL